ncbi:MAG: amino acid decarboxylase [Ruminococcaceae bacterium]|nr:amino acid decarboxylase [Oscillospiraceae bacterium]
MKTPICDFVRSYIEKNPLRLHMPGHKGTDGQGGDITEITGADSLYSASGIIRESEENAGYLFGANTFFSTEGSSHCIRSMVYLAVLHAIETGRRPHILAGRNAHQSFISAVAAVDPLLTWLYGEETAYLSCRVDGAAVETAISKAKEKPTALYLTSPDYLGNTVDISEIAAVCHRHDMLLLVDNAHGAYLRFLPKSLHPIDLGADIACDSAHKTLPVLTGGAYLHIRRDAPAYLAAEARRALALFGSTSPSYLILQSLDRANPLLAAYPARLASFLEEVKTLRKKLEGQGWRFVGNEPLKLTVDAKQYGYLGTTLADILAENAIECEFADPDFLVMMLTPEIGKEGLPRLFDALSCIPKRPEILQKPPTPGKAVPCRSIREAIFAPREEIPVSESVGRILAIQHPACPPAVPIVVAGERIDPAALSCFAYYGITHCTVLRS